MPEYDCPLHGKVQCFYGPNWRELCPYCYQIKEFASRVLQTAEEFGFDEGRRRIFAGPTG